MPLVIGYAAEEDIQELRNKFEIFVLDNNESKGLGIKPVNVDDILVATYIPLSIYDTMNTDQWDNTYIVDERDKEEQLRLGI